MVKSKKSTKSLHPSTVCDLPHPSQLSRVGHSVHLCSESIVLLHSFKACNVLLRFFSRVFGDPKPKRTMRSFTSLAFFSFLKNVKECKERNILFFAKNVKERKEQNILLQRTEKNARFFCKRTRERSVLFSIYI